MSQDTTDEPTRGGRAAWVQVEDFHFPANAVVAGHEADGSPLYAARASYRRSLIPGKVRPGFAGANIGHKGKEVSVSPFEVLVGAATWLAAADGQVPADAIKCGHDGRGQPLYLARARVGGSLHPGKVAPGMTAAFVPFGGVELECRAYEVLVSGSGEAAVAEQSPAGETLLFWDFENVMSAGGVSTSAGVSSAPKLISGFVSQTGGGPAEVFGEVGTVFLTRHLGSNEVFLWFTVTQPIFFEGVRFRHWHNHNPGFPTCPSYFVQLQIDEGDGYRKVGKALKLSNKSSGRTDTLAVGLRLGPGSYKLRWHPRRLLGGRDTGSEFFAMKDLGLIGSAVGTETDQPRQRSSGRG